MTESLDPAVGALLTALKAPGLDDTQRAALANALAALHASPAAPGKGRRKAPSSTARKAESLRLTRESISALTLPATGERYVYDTSTPQLAVRLRPGGATYVVVMWDRERRRAVKKTLGGPELLTPEQARRQAQAIVAQVADGEDVRRPAVEALTFGELIDAWHGEKVKTKRTADEMADKVRDHAAKLLARPVSEIERQHVGAIHHRIATEARRRVMRRVDGALRAVEVGKPGRPATADKVLAIMSSIFSWGAGRGLVAGNPCKGVAKAFNAKEAARQTYLHGDSLVRFWSALEADRDADVRDVLMLAIFTGQRRGNVLSMAWDHVDLEAGLWTIPGDQTKQKAPQTNALPDQAVAILTRRHADANSRWVFPAVRAGRDGKMGRMSETRPRDAWERITKAAGIEGVRIHDLRHTAGSWLARLGANEAIRQKALGHQTPAMAARYSHLELAPVADAMQRMSDAIETAAKRPARATAKKRQEADK